MQSLVDLTINPKFFTIKTIEIMKRKITILFCLLILTVPICAQDVCSKFYILKEGATLQYTSYDKKGNEEGTIDYKVHNVTQKDNATDAMMKIMFKDAKGKESITMDYNFSCHDNIVEIDYESMLNNEMLKQFDDMKMEISGSDIVIPNDLSVGQKLDDASVSMKMDMSGMKMNFHVDMINRSVEKKESITTPAGAFDCFVIYGESVTKMMMKQTIPSRMWLAEGVGMIKQESYDKGGKLMNSMVLTQYSN